MSKQKVQIFDSAFLAFGRKAVGLTGDNLGIAPDNFEWLKVDDTSREYDTVWFTDGCLHLAPDVKAKTKIAWLIEPPPYRQCNYDWVYEHIYEFDYVLTYNRKYLEGELYKQPYLFYPMGGSMISKVNWGIHKKTKLCSMVISPKVETTGHLLRRCIHDFIKDSKYVDIYGSTDWKVPYMQKESALKDYMFTIVIEGENLDYCFDEKIIDPFCVGTIPIYWGCPSIRDFFSPNGIISLPSNLFDTNHCIYDINWILKAISTTLYRSLQSDGILDVNLKKAHEYYCAEDWIYNEYPFLFGETNSASR